jgi:hypothetical protein
MKRYTTAIFVLAAACTGAIVNGCGSNTPDSSNGTTSEGATGTVDLALQLANGATLNSATFTIIGPNSYSKTGSIDLTSATKLSAAIGGIPVGTGYTITINGTTTDSSTTCGGSATFNVTARTTTPVNVALTCKEAPRTGSVLVNGSLNICSVIDGISASPAEVIVGKAVALSAAAHDSDAGPSALTYAWSATSGSFSSASAANPTFTCLKPGAVTVTLKVSDGDPAASCADTQTAVVTCTNAPYLVPVVSGVITKTIMTVGDSFNNKPDNTPYRMVGIPDGLGAFDNNDGTFTVLMNHELSSGGAIRAHGANGAFVSKWQIRKADLRVLNGQDLTQSVAKWSTATSAYLAPAAGNAFSRFCSADLPAPSAFFDAVSGLGYSGRLFLNGEESGNEGKAWAHDVNGVSWELPRLGKASWENQLANPGTGTKTVVAGTDDSTPGQVYVYVGTKTSSGNPVEMAGLTNGSLYGVAVNGVALESSAAGIPSGTAFTLANLGNVENKTGGTLETESTAAGVTRFNRPEDGAWDPSNPSDFYFVTTNSFTAPSRLWRLHFTDINNPAAGGTIDMLLDGTEGHKMFDNLGIDKKGHVLLVEDVGSNAHIGKVWRYDIATDALTLVAHANLDLFTQGAPAFLTIDEEASGIIDAADLLGQGWFLVDVQAHYAQDSELQEGGQLLAIYDPGSR